MNFDSLFVIFRDAQDIQPDNPGIRQDKGYGKSDIQPDIRI